MRKVGVELPLWSRLGLEILYHVTHRRHINRSSQFYCVWWKREGTTIFKAFGFAVSLFEALKTSWMIWLVSVQISKSFPYLKWDASFLSLNDLPLHPPLKGYQSPTLKAFLSLGSKRNLSPFKHSNSSFFPFITKLLNQEFLLFTYILHYPCIFILYPSLPFSVLKVFS